MSECSHCGFPIRRGEHVRSFGTHVAHSSESRCLGYLQAEIQRLTLKCADLEADYLRRHREYMDYRYGSEGLPEGAEMTIERLRAALERLPITSHELIRLRNKGMIVFDKQVFAIVECLLEMRAILCPADETPPAKDEVLEAIRAGRVTYPPEVLPTGRWMPAEETTCEHDWEPMTHYGQPGTGFDQCSECGETRATPEETSAKPLGGYTCGACGRSFHYDEKHNCEQCAGQGTSDG